MKQLKKMVLCNGIIVILIVLLMLLPQKNSFAFWMDDLAYEGESIYNYLQVQENDRSVILSTNVMMGVQSIYMKSGGLTGMYYDYALAAPLMAKCRPQDAKVLILGLGTGTFSNQCFTYFPGIEVEGVEIDNKIANLAKEYFNLSEQTKVHVADGRSFLSTAGTYDVIMVDAYQDITIPFQMSTTEFFTEVKNHLTEGGVMVVNMNMRSEKEDAINDYLCDTIANVFNKTIIVPVRGGTNTELFASDNRSMIYYFVDHLEQLNPLNEKDAELIRQMERILSDREEVLPLKEPKILTDDKAPVELLGMKVLDEMIKNELSYYKELLKAGDFEQFFE